MNLKLEDCTAFIKCELTPSRFEHSLGVMQVMSELAAIYDLDDTAALVCGILHDAAKELTIEQQLELARKGNISFSTPYDSHPMFLHGPAGACYIARELGVNDPIILEAITRHSYWGTGATLAPTLCWCLRLADVLEPGRDWKEFQRQLRPLVYSGQIKAGAYLLTEWMIPFLETKSIPVHPNMHRILNELSRLMSGETSSEANCLPV